MGDNTNGWSEGGAAAWQRDAKAAPGKMKMDLDTSVSPERTAFPAGNLSNPKGTSNAAPAHLDTLMNPLTRPGKAKATKDSGKGLMNSLTRAKGKR